jgi:hypothetical protein
MPEVRINGILIWYKGTGEDERRADTARWLRPPQLRDRSRPWRPLKLRRERRPTFS